jgi:predicted aspartyl protease
MAKIFSFKRESEDDLIVIPVWVQNTFVKMVLDTGASHSFIDFGILVKEGFRLNDTKGLIPVETANGIIYANRFKLDKIEAFDLVIQNFEITSYLFEDPESEFMGVIGLDFLKSQKFCIDLEKEEISFP